jgi:hypothetical protein
MRVNLMELLESRSIIHPTQIDCITLKGCRLSVVSSGFPWWETKAPKYDAEGSIEFIFEDVSRGHLDLHLVGAIERYEALESFGVRSVDNIDWAQPSVHSIYCSAPTPDPLELYARLQDHLEEQGAFMRAAEFLNMGTGNQSEHFSFGRFRAIASSRSYLVGRGPESIRRVVCAELARQNVPHNVLTHELDRDRRLWVRFGGSDFLCNSAVAAVEPRAQPT